MNPIGVALTVFLCAAGAALAGAALRSVLPPRHLDPDSRDVLKLVMGLIATLSALVLGLLIAGAQSSYNTQAGALQKMAANIVELDHLLASYGPETAGPRRQVREVVIEMHDRIWKNGGVRREAIGGTRISQLGRFYAQLAVLSPRNDSQRFALSRALQLADDINLARLLLYEESRGSLSTPFLAVLVFWICALFLGFGLLARFQATLAMVLLVGAASVAVAIYLILELNAPYRGIIQLTDTPIRDALAQLGR